MLDARSSATRPNTRLLERLDSRRLFSAVDLVSADFEEDFTLAQMGHAGTLRPVVTLDQGRTLKISAHDDDVVGVGIRVRHAGRSIYVEQATMTGREIIYRCRFKDVRLIKIAGSDNRDVISLRGDPPPTVVRANAGNDVLYGSNAIESLYGGDGDDSIHGGRSGDRIFGDDGRDLLYGEAGDDRVDGGKGDDSLYGGGGRDRLDGGEGRNAIAGGSGIDYLRFRRSRDKVEADGKDQLTELD